MIERLNHIKISYLGTSIDGVNEVV